MLTLFGLAPSLGYGIGQPSIVDAAARQDSFALLSDGSLAAIQVDTGDWPGVRRAANDLRADIARVTGLTPQLDPAQATSNAHVILLGTIGKNRRIDDLIRDKRINVESVAGKWEASLTEVVKRPWPGVESALVIAGSDKRGTIYGIYNLSESIGVSPWYWWADVPVRHQNSLFVKAGRFVQGPPAVQYRGIFLNDEAPALAGWAREKFCGFNH